MSDTVFQRVNGEQLHGMRGQAVCLLGKLTGVCVLHFCLVQNLFLNFLNYFYSKLDIKSQTETSFQIESADGKVVECKFKVPIRDSLSEIVEVYGNVDERGNLNCENYATFETSQLEKFGQQMVVFIYIKHTFQVLYPLRLAVEYDQKSHQA